MEFNYLKNKLNLADGFNNVNYFIMSDNSKLINNLTKINFHKTGFLINYHYASAIQGIVNNDMDSAKIHATKISEISLKKKYKRFKGFAKTLFGICETNQTLFNEGINTLLEDHQYRYENIDLSIIGEHLSMDTCAIYKLGLRNNMKMEINHPLLNVGMLEINELEKYERYDFLLDDI